MELPREEVMALYVSGFERRAAALSGLPESNLDASGCVYVGTMDTSKENR